LDKPRKYSDTAFDILEKWIPIICFSLMFVVFLIQVFSRYLFNRPLFWADELVTVSYIWAVSISASYVLRRKGHISFPIVYDKLSPRGKAIFRIAGNAMILFALFACMFASVDYLHYLRRDKTPVLRIPTNCIYLSILLSFALISVHLVKDTVADVRFLSVRERGHDK
jgi:TRAP-type C4-dicarboxylate transport system permease small subunit